MEEAGTYLEVRQGRGCVYVTWAVSQDRSQRAVCLVEGSVNTVLEYSVHFGQETHVFILY